MSPETLSDYWRQTALDLISERHLDWNNPSELAVWVGRASAMMAEAMLVNGDTRGVDELTAARAAVLAEVAARRSNANA